MIKVLLNKGQRCLFERTCNRLSEYLLTFGKGGENRREAKMAQQNDGCFYIELCKNPIRFDPVDKVTNVFYDDANRQVNVQLECCL